MRVFAIVVLFTGMLSGAASAAEKLVQFEIPANEDVIVEGHNLGRPAVTAGMDSGGSNLLSESEARFRSGNPNRGTGRGFGDGLPDDGLVGPVKLLPYDGKNVAQRRDDAPIDIKPPQHRYAVVALYASIGSDSPRAMKQCVLDVVLTYATGQPEGFYMRVTDWCARPRNVVFLIEGLDRTQWTPEGTLDNGWQDLNMATICRFPVPADSGRVLTGIRIIRKGPEGVLNLFAAAGLTGDDTAVASTTPTPNTPTRPATSAVATTPGRPTTRPKPADFPQWVHQETAATLDQLEADGDFATAAVSLADVFDEVIARAPRQKLEPFRESALALRLVRQLSQVPQSRRVELLKYLRANPDLASTLVFLMQECNIPRDTYALLDRLREQRGPQVQKHPNLTAAICVVHDRPLVRTLNENQVRSPDALAIFDYFVENESRLALPTGSMPAELLIYVVDTTANVEEMNWALAGYAGNRTPGQLYSAIRYDDSHVRAGTPKKVTVRGYNLPNLLACGGVCVDQAYFASAVGKSLGAPTAIVHGRSGEAAHAWLGYFQAADRQSRWSFDVGRFEAYRGVGGSIDDPQTRRRVPETDVALLAEMGATNPKGRQTARALADAARRLQELADGGREFNGLAGPGDSPGRGPRTMLESGLELINLAVRLSPGDRRCWDPLLALASAGKLTIEHKKGWTGTLEELYGSKYPDVLVTMIVPMVRTVDDIKERDRLWNWLSDAVRMRPHLLALVRMEQGAMWDAAGFADRASPCYMDVIERYPNNGPFVIEALQKREQLMRRGGEGDQVAKLYERVWARIPPPRESAIVFLSQSNWYRVGALLASRLEAAGNTARAAQVRQQLAAKGR